MVQFEVAARAGQVAFGSDFSSFLMPEIANNQILQILRFKMERDGPVVYNPPLQKGYRCHRT